MNTEPVVPYNSGQRSALTYAYGLHVLKKMKISSEEARKRGWDPESVSKIEASEQAQIEAQKLKLEIDRVFTAANKPRITLSVASALDDEWNVSEERRIELAKNDPETDWREVSKEKTEYHQEYFAFSDSEGWRFYLPAFMCHYLEDFPNYGYDAVYDACTRANHLDEMNESEMTVILNFLDLCARYEEH